jgi:hypothetical protein
MDELDKYLESKATQSKITKMWVECFIKPFFIIMHFVGAERKGDWPLHLSTVEKMLPYFFASGHTNYARYGLIYFRSMQCLHLTLFKKIYDWATRHAMWSDLFIETTHKRYGHGSSGIIGSTLAIWALSQSSCAQIKHDIETIKNHGQLVNITKRKDIHRWLKAILIG